MKIIFEDNENEKIVNDWNLIAGTVENSGMTEIIRREDLLTAYDVDDFGYSPKSQSFWAIAKPTCEDDENFKQFKEMLKYTNRCYCYANAPYFIINSYGALESFKHVNDACSPIDFGLMADYLRGHYFTSDEDREKADFYDSLNYIITHEL